MKPELPDIDRFERIIFHKKNTLDLLLSFSLKLMQAKNAGLIFGTNKTYLKFIPPEKWDRGVVHKLQGRGISGFGLKYFGSLMVKQRGLSPIRLYRETQFGEKNPTDGIISFVLRTYKDFYENGLKILIIDNIPDKLEKNTDHADFSIHSYNGKQFSLLSGLKINTAIVRQFNAENFVSAHVPDYGAIVFNTMDQTLIQKENHRFVNQKALTQRLDILISAIEMASIAHIGSAKGRQAAHIIWRKEKTLRRTAQELKKKAVQLAAQKEYLRAVGAVDENQLNMEAVNITGGVYAFIDMVGSANIRKQFQPGEYFFILNLCHQIAADNANRYACRVDNFMGDAVFLINASPFDGQKHHSSISPGERIMLMIFMIASFFNDIRLLKTGHHVMDKECRVKQLIDRTNTDIGFRSGMEMGSAMIGPLGSRKRKIVTAIGKAVNTAARLERSGLKEGIHISDDVMTVLKDAGINRNMRTLWKILSEANFVNRINRSDSRNFLDCYGRFFGIMEDVVHERSNISYKEFSKPTSYLIRCIPGSEGL